MQIADHRLVLREHNDVTAKVSAVVLVVLVMILLSWRCFQRKRMPRLAEEQLHAVATLHEAERLEDLEEGRAAATPTAEVAGAAGHGERTAMANHRLDNEEEQKEDLEKGTPGVPLSIAFNATRCQTEEKQGKDLVVSDGEEASQAEGAQLSAKETPALMKRVSADRLDRDEDVSAVRQDQLINEHCAQTVSALATEEQGVEKGGYVSKLCGDGHQREVLSVFDCGVAHERSINISGFCHCAHNVAW